MDGCTTCPGCRLQLPAEDGEHDHRVNASPECLRMYGEVGLLASFASPHLPLLRLHQLSIDTYGAQHGGGGVPPIRLDYSLVGLHLALARRLTGDEVRAAHQQMGKPDATWPTFTAPDGLGSVTIMTVAEHGLMSDSAPGHAAAAQRWAEEVWAAWSQQRLTVASLTARLLPAATSH